VTIAKGTVWGFASVLPDGAPVVGTDHEVALLLAAGVTNAVPAVIGLEGGAIWEMLGGQTLAGRLRTDRAYTYPIDLGVLETNGDRQFFVNHVVAHSPLWTTGFAVLNGQSVRGLRLGHRSHPNDGVLDATQWSLHFTDLRPVRNRARHGAHTPHPRIVEKRAPAHTIEAKRRLRMDIDGRTYAPGRIANEFRFSVIADAGFVVA
jgi:diacylglycerol kinase family enzyme